jgi:hypothetical protein
MSELELSLDGSDDTFVRALVSVLTVLGSGTDCHIVIKGAEDELAVLASFLLQLKSQKTDD